MPRRKDSRPVSKEGAADGVSRSPKENIDAVIPYMERMNALYRD